MQVKTCNECKCIKKIKDFYKKSTGKLGVDSICSLCIKAKKKNKDIKKTKKMTILNTNLEEIDEKVYLRFIALIQR